MERLKAEKRILLTGIVCFLLGAIWFLGIRFALLEKDEIHYHANFAVFINGERDAFDSFTFYEEVQACGGDEVNNPRTRAHMHDNINYVVHVHDTAATWGHFFANLSYTLGPNLMQTDAGVFINGENGKTLTVWLNGESITGAQNRPILSEDVLLLSYGDESDAELQKQYDKIEKDAAVYNTKNDPSACSGGKPLTLSERFEQAVRFWE